MYCFVTALLEHIIVLFNTCLIHICYQLGQYIVRYPYNAVVIVSSTKIDTIYVTASVTRRYYKCNVIS